MTNSNEELYIVPFTHDVIVLEQNTTVQKK